MRRLLIAWGLSEARLHLVAHGLERPVTASPEHAPRAPGSLRLAYLGQVIPAKGLHVLLDAVRRLRRGHYDITLDVHGGGTDPAYERRLRRIAGPNEGVYWHGPYAPGDVWSFLGDVDAVVVPSLWREIGPLVMYEALAAGRPVVASDLPNMYYVVQHGRNGLLFRPGRVADLARQLARLTDEVGLLAHLRAGITPPRGVEEEMSELMAVYRGAGGRSEAALRRIAI